LIFGTHINLGPFVHYDYHLIGHAVQELFGGESGESVDPETSDCLIHIGAINLAEQLNCSARYSTHHAYHVSDKFAAMSAERT
jgi:hypothetical protein